MPGSVELFEALDADLDRIAFVLDALREGKTNVALPWMADKDESTPAEAGRAAASEIAAALPAERTVVVSLPKPDQLPSRAEADAVDVEGGGRAMLRVSADTLDRLVNEAGEVAIARARIEANCGR